MWRTRQRWEKVRYTATDQEVSEYKKVVAAFAKKGIDLRNIKKLNL